MRKDLLTALKLLPAALAFAGCTDPSDFDATQSLEEQTPTEFECDKQKPTPAFCDDFDDDPIGGAWETHVQPMVGERMGVFAEDNAFALSGAQSLLARINGPFMASDFPNGEYSGSWGYVGFGQLKGEPIRVRVSFDLRVEETEPAGPDARALAFAFLLGTYTEGYNQFTLNFSNTTGNVTADFNENKGSDDPADASTIEGGFKVPVALNQWRHFVMDLDIENPLGAGENYANVRLDGAPLFDGKLEFPLKGATPRMELGIPWADKDKVKAPWQIRYDNVLVFIVPK